jgi:hypothetical protein
MPILSLILQAPIDDSRKHATFLPSLRSVVDAMQPEWSRVEGVTLPTADKSAADYGEEIPLICAHHWLADTPAGSLL